MKILPLFVFPGVTNASEASLINSVKFEDLSKLVSEYEYPYNDCSCRCSHPSPDFPKNFVSAYLTMRDRTSDDSSTTCFYYVIPARCDIMEAFDKAEIDFILAFPRMTCKDEYIARYINSSNLCHCGFVGEMTKMWGQYITDCYDCRKLKHCIQSIILESGQTLRDVFEQLDLISKGEESTFDRISKIPYMPYYYRQTKSPMLEGNIE